MLCIVHSPVCAAAGLPQEFSTSCSRGSIFWCGSEQCETCLVIQPQRDSSSTFQNAARLANEAQPQLQNVTQAFVDRVGERHVARRLQVQFNHCWFPCRAAERRLTGSIQTPKSGVLSAAPITATHACKSSTLPMFTWSRCLMTRWASTAKIKGLLPGKHYYPALYNS